MLIRAGKIIKLGTLTIRSQIAACIRHTPTPTYTLCKRCPTRQFKRQKPACQRAVLSAAILLLGQ